MKAIIFGISGQDGFYLREICTSESIEVLGITRSRGPWLTGDVSDYSFVEGLIRTHQPGYVFHLAANSTTQHSALFENHKTISTGTLNILEAVCKYSPKTKVFLTGSAMQFENRGLPIDEKTNWCASSPYSVARIQSTYAGRYYRKLGLDVYVGYLFNHDSPHRAERHISQKIAKAIKRISNGSKEIIEIGNLLVRKEHTFAGDVARAMWLLVNNDKNVYECVIGSGKAYSIKSWLEACCANFRINWQEIVKITETIIPEYDVLVSNPGLLLSLGWTQTVEIEELAKMMTK